MIQRSGNSSASTTNAETLDLVTLDQCASEYLHSLLDDRQTLYETGLNAVDDSIGGVARGELAIVGARPSNGKTLFGLQWLNHVASTGVTCGLISEEMSIEMLGKRTIQFASTVNESQWKDRLGEVQTQIESHWERRSRVFIPRRRCRTFQRACEAMKLMVERHAVEFVVLDYMQLLSSSRSVNRYEDVTAGCMALKTAAVELNIALVCLCQLNRAVDSRGDGRPKFSDLRDSGQIEQDADVILFLDWPVQRDPKACSSDFSIYCAKNRNRAIGNREIKLTILPHRQMLEDTRQPRHEAFDTWNQQ